MNQVRLQIDSFIRTLLQEGGLELGRELCCLLLLPTQAKLSPLSWTAADLWASGRLQVSLWHQAQNSLHSPGWPQI